MVYVNANLDEQTKLLLPTGKLTDALGDLCEETLYVTFVARQEDFTNDAWREGDDHFIRVVLPYDAVLKTDNIGLLASQRLLQELHLLSGLDAAGIAERLRGKMTLMG